MRDIQERVVKPPTSMQKVARAGNVVVLDAKNPHIRNTRDGTVIKLDVNNGVQTMDMWVRLDKKRSSFKLAGTESGQTAIDKLVRLLALCGGGEAEISQFGEIEDTEWNGVGEREVRMSEEAGE